MGNTDIKSFAQQDRHKGNQENHQNFHHGLVAALKEQQQGTNGQAHLQEKRQPPVDAVNELFYLETMA